MRIGDLYRRFRTGKYFMLALLLFCVAWLLANWLTHFDPDYGLYNTILSTEASINGTFIVILAEQFERWVRKTLEYQSDLTEAMHLLLKKKIDAGTPAQTARTAAETSASTPPGPPCDAGDGPDRRDRCNVAAGDRVVPVTRKES